MRMRLIAGVVASLCMWVGSVAATPVGDPQAQGADTREARRMMQARGTFDVKLAPLAEDAGVDDAMLGRMSIDKQYHGDIEGTGKGQMLTAGTSVKGSAAYVAIEKVSGTVGGRKGTFVLQHSGTMTAGTPKLTVTVVPDSGTGELAGIEGTLTIVIEPGKHSYVFDYTIDASR